MNVNELMLCERSPFWSIRVRQAIDETQTRVREVRSLQQCSTALKASNSALAVVEITEGNLAEVCTWTRKLVDDSPHPEIVVVGDRNLQEFEWLLRESGVLHAFFSPREVHRLSSILARCKDHFHLQEDARAAPFVSLADFDQIWSKLPWQS